MGAIRSLSVIKRTGQCVTRVWPSNHKLVQLDHCTLVPSLRGINLWLPELKLLLSWLHSQPSVCLPSGKYDCSVILQPIGTQDRAMDLL